MVYAPIWGSTILTVWIKYLVQAVRTLFVLARRRPGVVFVMSPPVFACGPVWIYCLLTRSRFVIDAHTGAFLNTRFRHFQWLQAYFSRRAVATIVTNDYLKGIVAEWGARAMIITDVPVEFAEPQTIVLPEGVNVTVVSSFCSDEPIDVFLEAASLVPQVNFHVTGDVRDLDPQIVSAKPPNVRFTGFLSDGEYVGQLLASDVVMALTTRDHTMQRGAYEAVYLERPVITSDFDLLKRSFPQGTVHVSSSSASSIADGVRAMQEGLQGYQQGVAELREAKLERWRSVAVELSDLCGIPSEPSLDSSTQVVHA